MEITKDELAMLLAQNNIKVKPSRITENGFVRTISMSHEAEKKLTRLSRKYEVSRSQMVRLLIEAMEE